MNRVIAIAGAWLACACFWTAAAQAQEEAGLTVLGSDPLTVSGKKGEDTAEAKFPVLNATEAEVSIKTVKFQASSDAKVEVEKWSPEAIPPGEAVRLIVTLKGVKDLSEAATGQLVIRGGPLPVVQPVEVKPAAPDEDWPAIVIFGGLLIALSALLVVYLLLGENRERLIKQEAPSTPKWEFDSWATTLTALGAVLGAVLGDMTFPSVPSQVSEDELVNLNIFFGVLVLIGPFLYAVLSPLPTKHTGTNWTMLVACTFTLWAVIGQLGAFGLLAWELLDGNIWAYVLAVAVVALIMLAWGYFLSTMSKDAAKSREDRSTQGESEDVWKLL